MMLLDTNVISELVRPVPNTAVTSFLGGQIRTELFTAAVCEAELYYGLARLPPGRRRDDLTARVTTFLATGFRARVLPFDSACAALYGSIRADRETAGKPISVEDAMIAATARAHGATLVSRNLGDFQDCGITTVDPWQPVGRSG